MTLLADYLERLNTGIRSGSWEPVGPFSGRDAIVEAYRAQPPDDEFVLLETLDEHAAVYAWAQDPTRPAGEFHLEERDGAIARIRVLYEQCS